MITKKENGFTLIELLIVVVLIGILSGVVLNVINVGGMRAKSRDAQRAGDLRKIQTALELYFADYRKYPASASFAVASSALSDLSTNKYINKLPDDPTQTGSSDPCSSSVHNYLYKAENTANPGKYVLVAGVEVSSSDDSNLCTGLNNWSTLGSGCSSLPEGVYCYGVENPL